MAEVEGYKRLDMTDGINESTLYDEDTLIYKDKDVRNVASYAKTFKGKVVVVIDEEAMVFLIDGKFEKEEVSIMGTEGEYAEFFGVELEEDLGLEMCSTCKGGGCVHCEPHRFM